MLFGRALKWFNDGLIRRPLLFKTVTGVLMAGTGDLIAQHSEKIHREKSFDQDGRDSFTQYDWRRFVSFTAFGAFWTGPVNHVWLRYLNQNVPKLSHKLLLQHGALNPFFYLPVFLTWNGLSQGKSVEDTKAYLVEKYLPSYVGVVAFWFPVSAFLFARVPERWQSVAMASISLLWNTMFSFLTNANLEVHKQRMDRSIDLVIPSLQEK